MRMCVAGRSLRSKGQCGQATDRSSTRVVSPTPLYEPGSPEGGRWQAIVTDDLDFEAPTRVIHFQDTMWLQLLATITLEQAQPLDP